MISTFLELLVGYVWGLPLIFLLIGGGLYLVFISGLKPFMGFKHSLALVCGKVKQEEVSEGQLSHFKALTNALAATVGLGNIAGVAVAITQGGAGAIFWMWVAALIGMNTKFFECSLAVMYRGKDYRGEVQGGPMYVIQKALGPKYQFLAILFAVFGLIGCLALFQMNQLADYLHSYYQVDRLLAGIVCGLLIAYILKGGIQRIAKVTSALVPFMCVFYILCCLVIIFLNFSSVPAIFMRIFTEAFSFKSVGGGVLGIAFIQVMKVGVKRAAFSNEAGIGTAPMAHSNAKTSEPISEGLVAMLGPFLDTIVVCTMTALVILVSFPKGQFSETSGVLLTLVAFEQSLPGFGGHFLGFAIVLFALTTMVGMANYNEKCWNFLFQGRQPFGRTTFILFFCSMLVLGSIFKIDDVINLLDSGYALMAFPNMMATILLAPKIKEELKKYFAKHHI